jgi:hypothetical protein
MTGILLDPVSGAGLTIPGSVFAVDGEGAITPFDLSSWSLSEPLPVSPTGGPCWTSAGAEGAAGSA